MTNFDFKKYLAENKLTRTTKLRSQTLNEGEAVYEYEKGKKAGEEELKEESNKQKLINAGYSESDAEDFADEFEQGGVKVPQKVKDILSGKSSSKMTKGKLKDKIKEMIVAEMNEPEIEENDFLKEIEDMLGEESEFDTNKPARIAAFVKSLDSLLDEYHAELYLSDDLSNAIEMVKKAANDEIGLNEAAKDEKADADVEAADDTTGEDTTAGDEAIDTTVDISTTEVDPNVKAVQDALTQAQAAAQTLGDPKLTDQIGNTITFFTRSHVVNKQGAVAEGEKMEEGYFGANNEVEELIDTLGYETMDEFFSDNPGVITAILNWASSVPEFKTKMIDNGLLEAKKENMNESLQNDDLIYDRMLDIDQEQLVSSILSFAENNPSITLEDYLNNEFGYNDDVEENKTKDLNESMFPMLKRILK